MQLEENCQAYCGNRYNSNECYDEWWYPDDTWVELTNLTDFSCHKGFEKVYSYTRANHHLARQWGDGTSLGKLNLVLLLLEK